MDQINSHASTWRYPIVMMMAVLSSVLQPAAASDNAVEREQLTALARQVNLVDRLAERAAEISPQDRARYHFDYVRLREDLRRVRAGIQDYLVPQRAQPRDPVSFTSDYVRSDRADSGEELSP
ncbi:integrative conjugative element protein, RAQPRD family [Pseudomonas fluorescens HK44]|uniref:Integrative conjugative element protein, RAQPRD family n=1 Tax=Pseudomonas fluorescens HK44 TaxID=1042209 RepID=A0A010SRV8_PSEFL|nr:RAQPRD family integrative conjugative element protein [Pseudomonas fluorescens]EXF93728.1 integrative conjugative element protein, RAQPRD family [Pseudomonas fluorescens HK44]